MSRRKRNIRAIDVKRFDLEKLSMEVAGRHIVFGVDIAKKKDYS